MPTFPLAKVDEEASRLSLSRRLRASVAVPLAERLQVAAHFPGCPLFHGPRSIRGPRRVRSNELSSIRSRPSRQVRIGITRTRILLYSPFHLDPLLSNKNMDTGTCSPANATMDEAQMDPTTAISELVHLKAKIEHENSELLDQRDRLREQLTDVQLEKENGRRHNCEVFQRIIKARLDNITATSKVAQLEAHIGWQKSLLQDLELGIGEQLGLSSFEEVVSNLRQLVEGALNFYSDDSLQYELTKRAELNRDKRVELTRLTNEVEEKKRYIEAKKKEMEAAKISEQKRLEEEEKRNKKLEEEKILAEKMRQREQFLHQKSATHQAQPFRTISFNGCSPEPSHSFSPSIGGVSPANCSNDTSARDNIEKPSSKLPTTSFPTFSQLTRW